MISVLTCVLSWYACSALKKYKLVIEQKPALEQKETGPAHPR